MNILLFLVLSVFLVFSVCAFFYCKFGYFKEFYHDILHWHEPTGDEWSDGFQFYSKCKYCDKEIIQDSYGNWFLKE